MAISTKAKSSYNHKNCEMLYHDIEMVHEKANMELFKQLPIALQASQCINLVIQVFGIPRNSNPKKKICETKYLVPWKLEIQKPKAFEYICRKTKIRNQNKGTT